MNKRVFVVFVSCFLFLPLFLNLASSQEMPNIFGIDPESGVELTEKWETLGTEWKTNLLQSSFISGIDSFLQKINFLFLVLLGMDYSLSLAFFLTIGLWLYFFFISFSVLGNAFFSKPVSLGISFGIAILLGQAGLFQVIVNFVIGLFFGENPWWVKLIIGVLLFALLIFALIFIKNFSKHFAESRKKLKEEKNRLRLEAGAKVGEELSKAVSKRVK